jgi:integrase
MQVSEVLHEYTKELMHRKTSPNNMMKHHSVVRTILNYMGDISHERVNRVSVREYMNNRRVKPQTASREMAVLRAALHFCSDEELIDWKPFKFDVVKAKPRERFLSQEEIASLLSNCNGHLKLWTMIALSTAARSGAILGLKCDRVNFNDNIIDFRNVDVEGRQKPRSVIRMPEQLRPHLEGAVSKSVSGYVIEKNGQPLTSIYKEFKSAGARAGLQDVSPHTLRHTCAVHMVKNGVPIYEVSKYLGHESVQTTETHYAKFAPDFMQKSSAIGSMLIQE